MNISNIIGKFIIKNIYFVALAIILITIIGSVWYIKINSAPVIGYYSVKLGNITGSLDEPGVVVAENKADISFQEGGQIKHVYVSEGQKVSAGTLLADLDTQSLQNNVNQSKAALAAAQAKLSELQMGATPQQIAVSEAALKSAQQALANVYANVPSTINDAYAKANDAVRNQLSQFFSSPESYFPLLTFNVTDPQVLNNIQILRVSASANLNAWKAEIASSTNLSSNSDLDAMLANANQHLSVIQNLMNEAVTAVNDEAGLSASTQAAYKTLAATGLNETNAAIAEINAIQQSIASSKAAVNQAQAALNLTTASSTQQQIEAQQAVVNQAQAALASAQVMLNNASLIAPFSGTIQNLTAQVGEVVSAGMPILSIVNNGGLKIQAYVSEYDVEKVKIGDQANVTLDAFGVNTIFPAIVTTIDSAETNVNGTPSYLVTLHFINEEPQIKDGMTGNVHIIFSEAQNVVVVPTFLVLNNGNEYFVLLKTSSGVKPEPVQLGLSGSDGMTEIVSGLNPGDEILDF